MPIALFVTCPVEDIWPARGSTVRTMNLAEVLAPVDGNAK